MTAGEARGARTPGGTKGLLTLIHRNKASNPALARVPEELTPQETAAIRVYYEAIVGILPYGHWVRLQIGAMDGRADARTTGR